MTVWHVWSHSEQPRLLTYQEQPVIRKTQKRKPTLLNVSVAVYSYFEKGCWKKFTRQSRKVFWVVLSSLFLKRIWKNGTKRPDECLQELNEINKSSFDNFSVRNSGIDYIPYHLSGLSRAHFSDSLSRNSWTRVDCCLFIPLEKWLDYRVSHLGNHGCRLLCTHHNTSTCPYT